MEKEIWIVINILQVLCLLEGLVFGFYIAFKSRKDNGDLYLGLFLLSLVSLYVSTFINNNGFIEFNDAFLSRMWYWPFSFFFAQFPILFLYLRWLVKREKFKFEKHASFFVPAGIEFLLLTILFFSSSEIRDETITNESYNSAGVVLMVLVFFWNLYMFYITNLILKQNRDESYITNPHLRRNIKWVKYAQLYILGMSLVFVAYWLLPDYDPWFYLIIALLDTIFIFWIIFFAISQKSSKIILEDVKISTPQELVIEELIEIDEDEYAKIPKELVGIIEQIERDKYYEKADMSLNDLAHELHISPKKLSGLINNHTDGNYNVFINRFRVQEAKKMILSEKFKHFSMEAIAYAVGFKSTATFYRVFKSITGKTPLELKESKLN